MTENTVDKEPDIGSAPDIESSADGYALRFSGKTGKWLLDVQSNFTKEHIQKVGASHILDVGGGHAQNVELVESMNISLTVTGSNNDCGKRVERVRTSEFTQFICTPLNKPQVVEGRYSHLISYRIVSHMIDWQGFIVGLCRVSSDAVTIDFATQRSVNFFSELAFKLKRGQEGDTRRYNVLAERDVDKVFAACGYIKSIRSTQFFFPMAIHRQLKYPVVSSVLEKIAQLTGLSYLFGSPVIATYRRMPR